jgi:hypothetical protein
LGAVVISRTRRALCAAAGLLVGPCHTGAARGAVGAGEARQASAVEPPVGQGGRGRVGWAVVEDASPAPRVGGTGHTGCVCHALVATITVAGSGVGALDGRDRVGSALGLDVAARAERIRRTLDAGAAVGAIEPWVARAVVGT